MGLRRMTRDEHPIEKSEVDQPVPGRLRSAPPPREDALAYEETKIRGRRPRLQVTPSQSAFFCSRPAPYAVGFRVGVSERRTDLQRLSENWHHLWERHGPRPSRPPHRASERAGTPAVRVHKTRVWPMQWMQSVLRQPLKDSVTLLFQRHSAYLPASELSSFETTTTSNPFRISRSSFQIGFLSSIGLGETQTKR